MSALTKVFNLSRNSLSRNSLSRNPKLHFSKCKYSNKEVNANKDINTNKDVNANKDVDSFGEFIGVFKVSLAFASVCMLFTSLSQLGICIQEFKNKDIENDIESEKMKERIHNDQNGYGFFTNFELEVKKNNKLMKI